MADWRNRIDQIANKVKFQLNARGVDNMVQLKDTFLVSFGLVSVSALPFRFCHNSNYCFTQLIFSTFTEL